MQIRVFSHFGCHSKKYNYHSWWSQCKGGQEGQHQRINPVMQFNTGIPRNYVDKGIPVRNEGNIRPLRCLPKCSGFQGFGVIWFLHPKGFWSWLWFPVLIKCGIEPTSLVLCCISFLTLKLLSSGTTRCKQCQPKGSLPNKICRHFRAEHYQKFQDR